ncbi:Coronin-like protein [Wickerhamomyces ciferrii]|uniref:Coronin n=1 Tax=Wickerhamomyces ciferrii (strain ATCC 14091 / BCRC 22168 / CBS 111 / JCM 3599 / NBRC 0793 / NRRL Y-1031 F-60-10) TaxID=1206466 RepID=K0KQ12_WICCF|nr:Coronin-like protein [Wickerhamomyces ciferrii]CCH43534.1 Coronin-like protein [Wickerhamomyces ciferrii]
MKVSLDAANGKYISVNWNSSGGGAFGVIPVNEVGKAPDKVPLFRGHTAAVLDTDFNPFNDNIIISGSDDAKLGVWKIPDDYSFHNYTDEKDEVKDISPVALYSGHKRKIGHVQFHPVAENVAASSSGDYSVKLWDIESGKDNVTLQHKDLVTSFSFNYNGNLLATTSRDRKLRVWDIRSNKIISEGPGHTGAKNSRAVWLGNSDRIGTTGFSKLSDRQLGVWDATNIEAGPIGGFYTLDSSAGIMIPFYDDSNKILYVGGKGDGNIRYYEFQDDELFPLSEYQSIEPQRGLAFAPKRTVNVADNEVVRIYKTVNDQIIEPVSFIVPRKSDTFQDDIYPDAPSSKPALSAVEWFDGKSVDGPVLFSVESLYNGTEPSFKAAEAAAPSKKEEPKKEEPKKEEPKKEEPKKEEPKEIKKSPEPKAEQSSRSSPKGDLTDLSKDKDVDALLKKAVALDDEPDKKDDDDNTEWDEEDKKPKSTLPEKKVETSKPAPKEEQKVEPKVETKIEAKSEPKSETKAEPKAEPKVEAKSAEPAAPVKEEASSKLDTTPKEAEPKKSEESSSSTASKPLTLKQSIEKIHGVAENLEQIVERLIAANLDKDERIKSLEEKVQALVDKSK